MSGTENNQTLDEHLRLGAGFAAADRPRIPTTRQVSASRWPAWRAPDPICAIQSSRD